MCYNFIIFIRTFDPVLEKLRREVDGPPNLDKITLEIQKLTSQLHVAYLFEQIGMALLQKICLFMSSTQSGKIYNGWQEFATELSLTREQIQCIDYDFKGLQDPTYYVLLTFAQDPNATIDKILIALKKISRLDIINRIIDVLTLFINHFHIDDDKKDILKPPCIPRVPLVLRPIINCNKNNDNTKNNIGHLNISSNSDNLSDEQFNNGKINSIKSHYGSIVMLTFTKDGEKVANIIAKLFRENNPKIGVLILQEQEKQVYSRAEEFIDDCFKQVNYIIPILTTNYINRINGILNNNYDSIESSLDEKYVKYIFSLLRYEYMKNKCCNNRVRFVFENLLDN